MLRRSTTGRSTHAGASQSQDGFDYRSHQTMSGLMTARPNEHEPVADVPLAILRFVSRWKLAGKNLGGKRRGG
jgi:hypothetical protein